MQGIQGQVKVMKYRSTFTLGVVKLETTGCIYSLKMIQEKIVAMVSSMI